MRSPCSRRVFSCVCQNMNNAQDMMAHRSKVLKRKRFYKWRQPCFGFYLQGGVKSLAIMDIGIELTLLIIQIVATLDAAFITAWTSKKELDLVKFYVRPVHWLYYYIYFVSNIFLSVKLYQYASERKVLPLKKYFCVSIILFIPWVVFFLSHTFWISFENKRGLATFVGFTFYKLYSFWLVSSFIKEIEYYGELNGEMTRLLDKEIENFCDGTKCKNDVEIRRSSIILDYEKPLGSGAFGIVLKGKLLRNQGDPFYPGAYGWVGVKTVSPDADILYFKALLSELKILSYIGRHEHIVNLLGACTSELKDRKIYVVVEFCALGSIYNYLRANRAIFDHDVGLSQYVGINMQAVPTTRDLIKWSMQTASGMEYISSKGVIHGDLASRNVLLTEDGDVKIADFGLSRQLYHYAVYQKHNLEPMPWRWTAPEALCDHTFSTKSDVWSFGITLWEYFSCAATPYPGIVYGEQFLSDLQSENVELSPPRKMGKPAYASQLIYDEIIKCWEHLPDDRPTFTYFKTIFNQILSQQS